MTWDREARRSAEIAVHLDERGDLAPPWARLPEIPLGSIGWRMGFGEDWLMLWTAWMARQPRDPAARLAYLQRHPPAPRGWESEVLWVVDPDFEEAAEAVEVDEVTDEVEDDEDDDPRRSARLRELEAAGVIADDAAYPAWRAQNDPPAAPWTRAASLALAARYDLRGLTFFGRWAGERREAGALEEWLADAAPAPADWAAFRAALVRGDATTSPPADPREQLAVALAARGEAPPPWTRGDQDPVALEHPYYDEHPTYAVAWVGWASQVFDDRPTWEAYLRRWPSPSPIWEAAARVALAWLYL